MSFGSWNSLRNDSWSWNLLYVDFSLPETFTLIFCPRNTDINHGTSFLLSFRSQNVLLAVFSSLNPMHIAFFSSWKLIHWFFRTWNWFCSWNMLRADVLLVELHSCWFLFVKHSACWFFSSWNLYIDLSPRETDFVNGNCCMLISVSGALLYADFYSWNLFRINFSSLNLYTDFSPYETDFVHGICCRLTLCSWKLMRLSDFCLWNLLHVDISHRETPILIFHLMKLFVYGTFLLFFVRWVCSVLIFVLETSCMLILLFVKIFHLFSYSWKWFCSWNFLSADSIHENCCVLIFVRETCCMLIFLFANLVHWFVSSLDWFLFMKLLACWFLFV